MGGNPLSAGLNCYRFKFSEECYCALVACVFGEQIGGIIVKKFPTLFDFSW
ncbi:hypothetical protein HMPREF3216_00163 [Gardnerella vaginalis]|uniref:Uncharacterized protein n=1 Tax=Gardnerella vaginalis TaxID=2702 RepID=A0A133NSR9_GARVA|nr:hypothetical protein HMPREF3216_00163 [Gardnerella vaginalis]